jgi:hypothetical protein
MTAPHAPRWKSSGRACSPALLVAIAVAAAAWPQLAAAASPPLCAALLTAEESRPTPPASSPWTRSSTRRAIRSVRGSPSNTAGDGGTFTLTVWDETGVTEGMIAAETPAEFFAMLVASAEQVRGTRPEALAGVGQRSAMFDDERGREVYLLTGRGVAHLRADGLTPSQCRELARAVASP